jgi:small subunit ribosomal protein S5
MDTEVQKEIKPEVKQEFKKNTRRPAKREARVKQEFDNKLLEIRRVTRVVSGGRRFSFSATVVVGDKKGKVGVGIGKAADTPIAIEKAVRDGKKNMVQINLTETSSIPHEVKAKYIGSVLTIMPSPGKGIIAGSAARAVLEMAGVNAVTAKFLSRSKNKINNARVAVLALSQLKKQNAKQ